jgi:hypothetical protein
MIQAIETYYKGYRFRSRLEARWAVFFDALEMEWKYEPEGYVTAVGGYLPDFYLPEQGWIEIKAHTNLSNQELLKITSFAMHEPICVMAGNIEAPVVRDGELISGVYGIAFNKLDRIPPQPSPGFQVEYITVGNERWCFETIGSSSRRYGFIVSEDRTRGANIDKRPWLWQERNDGTFLVWPYPAFEVTSKDTGIALFLSGADGELHDTGTYYVPPLTTKSINSPRLLAAYTAARSARFEHGETPKVPRGKPKR